MWYHNTSGAIMGFIERELEKISAALRESQAAEHYDRLYAAQQALAWVLEPTGFKAPYNAIMCTEEDSKGCLSESRPVSS